jgi:uncharacterized membrane protein YvbJ
MLKHQGLLKDEIKTAPVAPKIHKCPKCGTVNDVDHLFCKECGRALTDKAADVAAHIDETPESVAYYKKQMETQQTEIADLKAQMNAVLTALKGKA